MKVLLGICILASRTGAELFVRDVALGLNRRGHSVVVYAPIIGDMADGIYLRPENVAYAWGVSRMLLVAKSLRSRYYLFAGGMSRG